MLEFGDGCRFADRDDGCSRLVHAQRGRESPLDATDASSHYFLGGGDGNWYLLRCGQSFS